MSKIKWWLPLMTFVLALCLHSSPVAAEGDADAYDPFIDYGNFNNASKEDADINFFRNGRAVSVGGLLGGRLLTQSYLDFVKPRPVIGAYLDYFFNMNWVFHLSFFTGSHPFDLQFTDGATTDRISGVLSMNEIDLAVKFFFFPQTSTRGLPMFNPYALVGLSSTNVSAQITNVNRGGGDSDEDEDDSGTSQFFGKSAPGAIGGIGFEMPVFHYTFVGLQVLYNFVSIPHLDNTPLGSTSFIPEGDPVTLHLVLGSTF